MSTQSEVDESSGGDARRQRQPLARGIELLSLMVDSDRDTHGVRELASRLEVSPSTVHRLLTDLEKLGVVARTPSGSYRLGVEFLRLAWTTTSRYPLQEVATGTLQELMQSSGESSFFAIYGEQRRAMMFALTVESSHPLRYTLPMQQWLPLHAGASGLAILAFLPEDVREEIAHTPLVAMTDRTLIEPAALLERLETIRRDGYAITHGERIEGAIAIASPVSGPLGTVVGATGITIPETRFNATSTSALATQVRQAASRLTAHITGSRAGDPGLTTN